MHYFLAATTGLRVLLKRTTLSPCSQPHPTSSLEPGDPAANSATSYTPDPHAVSNAEAQFYYAGLHSRPTLLYRTNKGQWSRPRPGPWGPEARLRLKALREVFRHPIVKVWNHDLGWKVVEVLDAHKVS